MKGNNSEFITFQFILVHCIHSPIPFIFPEKCVPFVPFLSPSPLTAACASCALLSFLVRHGGIPFLISDGVVGSPGQQKRGCAVPCRCRSINHWNFGRNKRFNRSEEKEEEEAINGWKMEMAADCWQQWWVFFGGLTMNDLLGNQTNKNWRSNERNNFLFFFIALDDFSTTLDFLQHFYCPFAKLGASFCTLQS